MADSDVEISVDDVCDSMAADDGVEVETIIQGQAAMPAHPGDLDFMVQEEVETTTDGDTLTVELDPVDNVIIALQSTDSFQTSSHFREQNGAVGLPSEEIGGGDLLTRKRRGAAGSGPRRSGGGALRRKAKRPRKGSVRFANRQIPAALSTSTVGKDARESNEASFEVDKRARRWKRRKVPVKTLDGRFSVGLWCSGEYAWV